jgi:NAD-specific glutamate dehydrogenase
LEDVIKTLVRNVLIGQKLSPGFEKVEHYKVLLQELLKQQETSSNEGKSEMVLTKVVKTKKEEIGEEEIGEEEFPRSLDRIRSSLQDLRIAPNVLHLCLTQDLEVSKAYQIAISVEQKFGFDWLREKLEDIEPQNDWELEYQDILLGNLDSVKFLLLDVLHASSKMDSSNIPDDVWLIKTLEENSSSHLRSYFSALEQLRAGSLISLTTVSVILSRLDFLKKIKSTNLSVS